MFKLWTTPLSANGRKVMAVTHWQPALTPVLARVVGQLLLDETARPDLEVVPWGDPGLQAQLALLESHLAGREFIAAWYARLESTPAWQASAVGPWAY